MMSIGLLGKDYAYFIQELDLIMPSDRAMVRPYSDAKAITKPPQSHLKARTVSI